MRNLAHVALLSNYEKVKIANAFVNSPFNIFAPRVGNLNWTSTMNSERDRVSADGGLVVYVATDGVYTYLAEKQVSGKYNVRVVNWKE